MCGRFTLTRREADELAAELGVPAEALRDYRPRYNIAPGQTHLVLRMEHEDRAVLQARWGLINHWAKDRNEGPKQINARAETVGRRPAFRDAFKKRRCVVPADGFFEWAGRKGARQPLWFHRPDGGLILFAGLYESWQPEPDQWEPTFTIITTDANDAVGRFHDRMPVILPDEKADEWMFSGHTDAERLQALLVPAPNELLAAKPVSKRVNNVRNDDPDLLSEAVQAELV